MTSDENTSKVSHYLKVLLKQPGITKEMTLEQVQKIFDDAEKAAKVDAQLETPFYNQSKLSFQRLNKKGHTVLVTCKPAAVKLYLILANYINQSNVIYVSRLDLAKISEMSRPTINTASEELVYKGLMIIERGNEGQGEAITYILNPECLASGKLIYHKNLVYHYWEKAGEDAGFVTGLYDSVKSYKVTNMGNDIFAKLLAASQNGITDTETVPGEGTHGENFDEYHIDEDALSDLIISMFYEKIQ